jgi:hypothetical protein
VKCNRYLYWHRLIAACGWLEAEGFNGIDDALIHSCANPLLIGQKVLRGRVHYRYIVQLASLIND